MAKMKDTHKFMAFLLYTHNDFGYTQGEIARLMRVSQSTIAQSIKEITYRRTIENLERELDRAYQLIEQQGVLPINPVLYLEDNDD